jgi:VanZ family protein
LLIPVKWPGAQESFNPHISTLRVKRRFEGRVTEQLTKVLFWGWFALLAIVSLLPGKALDETPVMLSATGFWEHMLAYGVLAVLGVRAYSGRRVGMILAAVLVVSIGFEVIQLLFLGRTFNPMDVVANGIGLGTGWWMGKSFRMLRC